eukprot:scpid74410/ scgid20732/ 
MESSTGSAVNYTVVSLLPVIPPSLPPSLPPSGEPTSHVSVEETSAVVAAPASENFVWTSDWTKLLIKTYGEHQEKLSDINFKKKAVWRTIHEQMVEEMGSTTSPTLLQVRTLCS